MDNLDQLVEAGTRTRFLDGVRPKLTETQKAILLRTRLTALGEKQ